jgi:cation:H+ antiporter
LIGSNITNPLVAIGLGAVLSTYHVPRPVVAYDLPWATVSGALLLGYLLWSKGRIGRWGAVYFVVMYALYITFRALFFAVD